MLNAVRVLRPVDSCGVRWSESRLSAGGVRPGSRFATVAGVDSATVWFLIGESSLVLSSVRSSSDKLYGALRLYATAISFVHRLADSTEKVLRT